MTMTDHTPGPRHVVIAGGGFAGLGAAYTLHARLRPEDRVTLIEPSDRFIFAPSLVWAVLGRSLYHGSFVLDPALRAHGIVYRRAAVRAVRVDEGVVVTDDGEIPYDRLIIATGGRPDTAAIPGLAGEFGYAHWIVGEESALEARTTLRGLSADPGPVIIGAAQGATYFSGAYELALALDTVLRRQGLRERVPLTFITAEPYLGELGFGQRAAQTTLAALFTQRDIAYRTGVTIDRVGSHAVLLAGGASLPARASIIMPPFTGAVDIWKSAHLTDDRGIVPVNEHYQHVAHPAIYAAGVACSFDRPIPPLRDPRAPHTGYLAIRMGQAAAENVAASLGRGAPARRPLPRVLDIRLLDGGSAGVLLASWGTRTLHNAAVHLPPVVAHTLKTAQERYLVWRLRTGRMDLP